MVNFLQYLSEHKSVIMNAFEKKFGKNIYSNELDVELNTDISTVIFNVLNAVVFNNRLVCPKIICADNFDISAKLQEFKQFQYTPDVVQNYYAMYVPIANIIGFAQNAKFKFQKEFIFINTCHGKMTFAFLASSICHEMIHQYDAHFGDLAKLYKLQENTGVLYDIHTIPIFIKKMNFANKNNLTVKPNGNGLSFENLNIEAAVRANGIDESDKPTAEQIKKVMIDSGVVKWDDGTYVIVFGN